ncbi:MAG TPA: hypothetical protein VJR94_07815 [Candidatus Nitrosocosmicus sp.]|nr:hypothetical protein [Candidatus Nitrosocosmicus sp.]
MALLDIDVVDNMRQSLRYVIVVVGCNATDSVGNSGDTIIGSNDGNNNIDISNEQRTGSNTYSQTLEI